MMQSENEPADAGDLFGQTPEPESPPPPRRRRRKRLEPPFDLEDGNFEELLRDFHNDVLPRVARAVLRNVGLGEFAEELVSVIEEIQEASKHGRHEIESDRLLWDAADLINSVHLGQPDYAFQRALWLGEMLAHYRRAVSPKHAKLESLGRSTLKRLHNAQERTKQTVAARTAARVRIAREIRDAYPKDKDSALTTMIAEKLQCDRKSAKRYLQAANAEFPRENA